jgi:integrase
MTRKGLTAVSIANMKPTADRREIPDGKAKGLYLIIQPSGKKSFAVRYRRPNDGRPAKLTLGNGSMSLAAARLAAAGALHEVSQGRDPAAARKAAKEKAEDAASNTLRRVAEEWLARHKELRSLDQCRSVLERHAYPKLGGRPIGEIKRSEIMRVLDHVEDTAGPAAADKCGGLLGRIMAWHSTRDDEFRSPFVKGMNRTKPKERARTRVLDDSELTAVWKAADAMPVFGQLIQFALLTAARRNEAAQMTDAELSNGGDWIVASERYKSKRHHVVPLSAAAKAVLAKVPRIAGCPYVFSTDGRTPIAGFSQFKRKLDAASGVRDWRIHDLRRSSRSLMSRAGIGADIAERCLGHAMPTIRGIYDRHEFYAEKAHAFEAVAMLIKRIVEPPQDNVLLMRGNSPI